MNNTQLIVEPQAETSLYHCFTECGACQSCYTTPPLLTNITAITQPDSGIASVTLVITFSVAAVVITALLCIYFCRYRRHLNRQQLSGESINSHQPY